ncbi:MAG: Na/Pi cotransporter family protein [Lachnospiraceae bacterium]|nr:Na/Pi cotransporter family protein [Lachnospiraceae bacterium]
MDIFDVLTLICGLALFLYGMDVMGAALKKSAGRKLKVILGNLTSNKFKGFLLGLGVTAVIQSSSATTVMVVGFVNSGTMTLAQAIGVIMGANVGTAVTAWITGLNGIGGGAAEAAEWLKWLKPDSWMPILALIGICFLMFSKKDKKKDIGTILLGFAVLMVGMETMSGAVSGLKESPEFHEILLLFNNPFLGVLAGTVLTAIVQSSSASVGILQALSSTGVITYSAAMPIIMGQNIGTCVTAMLSSISANKNGKRAALIHLYFNIIGVILWMSLYYLIGAILSSTNTFELFKFAEGTVIDMWGIAAIHTIFKIFSVCLLMPISSLLEKLAMLTIKGSDKVGDTFTDMLDERLLDAPSVAIERSYEVADQMATLSSKAIQQSITLLDTYDDKIAQEIREIEDKVDVYEDVLGSYLVKLSSRSMTEADSQEVTKLLYMIGDFERISDHAVNLVESAEELKDKGIAFSSDAVSELSSMYGAVDEIVQMTEDSFINRNMKKAHMVEPLEDVVDYLKEQLRLRHIIRMQKEECTIEHGFILSDILTNLERVSDHCSNVASCLIEMSEHASLDLHEYIHTVREKEVDFDTLYRGYMAKYAIAPISKEK